RPVRYLHRLLLLYHIHRAELELWDFSVSVEGVDGEQLGGSLAEVERDEHTALLGAHADPRLEHDRAAPGTDSYPISILYPERMQIFGVDLDERFRLDGVQRFGAAGHGPSLPVREHPAGVDRGRV